MKVLHIIPSYYPAIKLGGPIQSVHLMNKELVKMGVEVDVLTLNVGLEKSEDYKSNLWYDHTGVKVKYLNYFKLTRYNFSFSFFINSFRIMKNYDLIHLTSIWNFPILIGSLCAAYFKKPFIISPRGSLYQETIDLKRSNIKKIYLKLFSRFLLKKASLIHYTARDEFEKVEQYLNIRMKSIIIYNGLDFGFIEQMKDDGIFEKELPELNKKKYLLSLGRITKKKGFDLLIPAFRKIASGNNDIYLVIAGPDDEGYLTEVKKMVHEHGVERKVIFTGLLDGALKWSVYRNASIFVLPSYSENFGNSVIESMACDTPVVISNKVGISFELKENDAGIIVDTDIESLYNGIQSLLKDRDLREKIIENGKFISKKFFDIESVASQMLDCYRQILK